MSDVKLTSSQYIFTFHNCQLRTTELCAVKDFSDWWMMIALKYALFQNMYCLMNSDINYNKSIKCCLFDIRHKRIVECDLYSVRVLFLLAFSQKGINMKIRRASHDLIFKKCLIKHKTNWYIEINNKKSNLEKQSLQKRCSYFCS